MQASNNPEQNDATLVAKGGAEEAIDYRALLDAISNQIE
jgi:hypothetical protein